MPINGAWRPMPSPHATAAARPPYNSVISRGTTKVRLRVQASSPPIGIKYLLRQQVKGLAPSLEFNSFSPETQNSTCPRGLFGILANLCVRGASPGHPLPPPERPMCRIVIPKTTLGTPTELPVEDPRGSINPQEVSTPTDVGELAHSDENRPSRHLSSTPESFVTLCIVI
ncbi:hypothetical protein BHM03_00012375 [Ensete ventricosum]|nr:hypothetical protein BHM03_00012375 [Ensete ventricosum]